jgi:gamma-glutamylcyclotransferase (GGCT)/AIG2-like uncharacterized protein YtfP
MTIYFAYGSNLNKEQMSHRCPAAECIGKYTMHNARLVFRGVADVVYEEGASVPGGLWKITPECEEALDAYEGLRSGLYRKIYVALPKPIRGEYQIMLYVMNSTGIMPPSEYYLGVIREGYRDFGLKQKPLNDAVEASHDDKAPSHIERRRHMRKGRPRLAERPSEKKAAKKRAAMQRPANGHTGPADGRIDGTRIILANEA